MYSKCLAWTVDVFKTVSSFIFLQKKIPVAIIVVVYLVFYFTLLNNIKVYYSSFSWSQLRVKVYYKFFVYVIKIYKCFSTFTFFC